MGLVGNDLITSSAVRVAPKVLLHDHLDGGLRPATVVELAGAADYQLPTNDADVAFAARNLLPLGGSREQGSHKGYALAMVVDILSGVLSGAGVPAGGSLDGVEVGHFFGAMRVDAFRPLDEFRAMMDEYLSGLRMTPTTPGEDEVIYPGILESRTEKERRERGIPLHPGVVEYLSGLASELGVEASLVEKS